MHFFLCDSSGLFVVCVCVCACVRACGRAGGRACVRVCVRARVCVHTFLSVCFKFLSFVCIPLEPQWHCGVRCNVCWEIPPWYSELLAVCVHNITKLCISSFPPSFCGHPGVIVMMTSPVYREVTVCFDVRLSVGQCGGVSVGLWRNVWSVCRSVEECLECL